MKYLLMPFAWLLVFFYNLFKNYGIAIFLFALVVKVVLFPFSLKGKRSMVKMSSLQGKQARLQKQYANNKEKLNEELSKLYEKENVNPMSGCLWSFVPLLILIPLYAILREPLYNMMNATADQVTQLLTTLNWSGAAAANGWTADFARAPYGQLQLASLINAGNLAEVQKVLPGAFAINFDFLGMNLAQQPRWDIWNQTLNWNNIGLFLMPIVSAVISVLFSVVMTRTNNINNPDAQSQGNFMNYIISPLMSLWIGYGMPAGLCVYWIANSLLSMVQELIAAKMLKKDYAAAAEARRQQEILAKEEEKRLKEELRAERARRAEEKKKGGKKKKEPKETVPGVDVSASRVGLRAYARGRAYDPNRYGGVTPYRDPDATVDEDAIEAAREAKAERAEEAKMEADLTARVAAEVEADFAAGKLTADESDAAETLEQAEENLDKAWEEVTASQPAEQDGAQAEDEPTKEE